MEKLICGSNMVIYACLIPLSVTENGHRNIFLHDSSSYSVHVLGSPYTFKIYL